MRFFESPVTGSNRNSDLKVRHVEEAVPSLSRDDLLVARLRVAKVVPFQSSATPFVSNVMLAVCSGFLLVFAFPDWNLWSLSWVAVAPLIMAIVRERRFWRSALLGVITGTIFYVGTSYWVTYSMNTYGGIPLVLCYVIGAFFAIVLALFTGLFAGILANAVGRFGGWALLAAPIVWPATEWLRLKATGMGWNALGYSQAFQPSVIQLASWGGVYAVSGLLVLAGTALVFGVIYLERPRGFIVFSLASLIAIGAVLHGLSVTRDDKPEETMSVAVIQPNVPISERFAEAEFVTSAVDRYLELSEQAIAQSNPDGVDLVIWPEAQVNIEYDIDLMLQQRIAEFTSKNNVYLLINSWRYPDDLGPRNSAMVIGPSGDKISDYDKIALMPFGEYVPGRGLLPFMKSVSALVGEVIPGRRVTVTEVAGARIGTFICFEAIRPEIARGMRTNGANALVQISNEAWFGPSAIASQMLAHTVFRAVENNVPVIRATNSGRSALIGRSGRIENQTPLFEESVRRWKVSANRDGECCADTFYTRHGDLFAIACAALSAILALAGVLIKPKSKLET